jgi:hypothetical protein
MMCSLHLGVVTVITETASEYDAKECAGQDEKYYDSDISNHCMSLCFLP